MTVSVKVVGGSAPGRGEQQVLVTSFESDGSIDWGFGGRRVRRARHALRGARTRDRSVAGGNELREARVIWCSASSALLEDRLHPGEPAEHQLSATRSAGAATTRGRQRPALSPPHQRNHTPSSSSAQRAPRREQPTPRRHLYRHRAAPRRPFRQPDTRRRGTRSPQRSRRAPHSSSCRPSRRTHTHRTRW